MVVAGMEHPDYSILEKEDQEFHKALKSAVEAKPQTGVETLKTIESWKPIVEPKVFTPMKEAEDYQVVWYCFECGARDDGTGERKFKTEHYLAGDCDVVCLACGSDHTGEYEDGDRSEECPVCGVTADPSEDCEVCLGYGHCYPFEAKQYKEDT